jgi:hypothetical protein
MTQNLFRVLGVFRGRASELGGLRLSQGGGTESIGAMNPTPNGRWGQRRHAPVSGLFQSKTSGGVLRHGSAFSFGMISFV